MITSLATCPQCGHELTPELRPSAPPPAPPPPPLPRYPVSPRPQAARSRGLGAASVPKILLGLGATCLLVAAVIFLAVAWSWLGIAGRTTVLVGLTVVTGAAGQWLLRRHLRMTAEALTTVALGLLVVDMVGAEDAGWLGSPSLSGLVALIGGTLLASSLALCAPARPLIVPQLSAPIGLAVLIGGLGAMTEHGRPVAALAVVAYAALALLGLRLRLMVLSWTAPAGGLLAFLALAAAAVEDAATHPSLRDLWAGGHGLWLLVAAALLLLPWAVLPGQDALRQLVCAASAVTVSCAAAAPLLDEGPTAITLAAAGSAVLWAALAAVTPPRWYAVSRVPLAGSVLALVPVPLGLAATAVTNLFTVAEPFAADAAVRLAPAATVGHPLLLPLAVGVTLLAAALTVTRPPGFWRTAGAVTVAAAFLTAALFPLPLWLFVAVLGPFGLAVATPSAVLTLVALVEVVALTVAVLVRRSGTAAVLAGCALPVAFGCLLSTAGHLADVPVHLVSLTTLAVLGSLALAVPRVELETTAWATVAAVAGVGITDAPDPSVSAAIHLTLAGSLVTASALLNPTRRGVAWVGGLLLAAATWVRLLDLGVQAPEAYTLPTATVLILLGLHRMRRDRDAASVPALLTGLSLATVPSLLWALADPVSPRAMLLGLACLVLLLAGSALGWTAPVLVGWLVGGLLVLRESAPYAAQTPQWVLIGTAGTLLIVVGVTWEARLRDLRQATSYLGRLR